MYESKREPLLPTAQFYKRLINHLVCAVLLIVLTLAVGLAAHLWLEPVHWHDALLNTAMIVSGLGPYILPATVGGKIFFTLYSIVVSLMFVATLGLILAPLAHRIVHKLHLDDD